MKPSNILKYIVLCLPLTAHAIPAPMTWNIDDPTGIWVGSFDYTEGGTYENVNINATNGSNTEYWEDPVDTGASSPSLLKSGAGLSFGLSFEFDFASPLTSGSSTIATTQQTFWGNGSPFDEPGTFAVTMANVPEYERPSESVPAPATLALFGLGLAGLRLSRRNRK